MLSTDSVRLQLVSVDNFVPSSFAQWVPSSPKCQRFGSESTLLVELWSNASVSARSHIHLLHFVAGRCLVNGNCDAFTGPPTTPEIQAAAASDVDGCLPA